MAGAVRAFQHAGDFLYADIGLVAGRVDLRLAGRPDEINAFRCQQREIAFDLARVAVQVGAAVELGGVYEDTHGDPIIGGAGLPHERKMPLVQRAHRGHEAPAQARILPAGGANGIDG